VLMDSRLSAQGLNFSPSEAGGGNLPAQVFGPFSNAMAESMLLPAGVLVLGFLAGISFARPVHQVRAAADARAAETPTGAPVPQHAGEPAPEPL
jgi:hypothetical protein